MINQDQIRNIIGATAYDNDGDKVGKVGNVYYDDNTDQPKWITVHTGMFGGNETFVPVQGADFTGDDKLTITYDKVTVKGAPNVSEDGHLSPDEEEELYRYYNLDTAGTGYADSDRTATGYVGDGTSGVTTTRTTTDDVTDGRDVSDERGIQGRDTSGPTTDDAMTRSEERLDVGTESRVAGTARLRKYIETEKVTETVPVRHEEVTIEREPITEANRGAAVSGGDLTEEEHEVTLHEEQVVTDKETVPVERVRLGTETVTEQERVDETIRKERIETDTDGVRSGLDDTER